MKTKIIMGLILLSTFTLHAQRNWDSDGNAGVGTDDTIGTTNNVNLMLVTNGSLRGSISSSGNFGVGTISPAIKLHVVNGSDAGTGYGFAACGQYTIQNSNYGVYSSVVTGSGINVAYGAYAKDNNSANYGGSFNANGNLTNTTEDCAFNVGISCEAKGDGYDSNAWITNAGVIGVALGIKSDNQGGGFYAENTGCIGSNIGVSAIASGGSLIAGIYAEGVNDSSCVTDSVTVTGGGKVPGVFAGYFNGNTFTAGTAYLASDRNLKQNFEEIINVSDLLAKLEVKKYTFNRSEYPEMHLPAGSHYGVIAQNVEEVFPDLVLNMSTIAPKNVKNLQERETYNIKAVNYNEFIPLLIAAHKEQQVEIEQLKQQLQQVCEQGCDKVNFNNTMDQGYFLNTFPNPTEETLQVSYALHGGAEKAELEVRDMTGKLHQTIFLGTQQRGSLTMDVSQLPAGNYFIALKENGGVQQSKLIAVTR